MFVACAGCRPPDPAAPATSASSAVAAIPSAAGPAVAAASPPAVGAVREVWEAHYLQGAKVGHARTSYVRESEAGRPVVKIVTEGTLRLVRFGKPVEQRMREACWEAESGEVLRFENSVTLGTTPQLTVGAVEGERATLTLVTAGKTTTQTIDWPRGTGGSTAPIDSLRRRPPTVGETRRLRAFLPVFNRIADVTLRAVRREPIVVDGAPRELLRIETAAVVEGNPPLESVAWCDEQGEVLKTAYPALQMSSVRTTEEAAKAADGAAPPDLGTGSFVVVDPPWPEAHRSTRAKYRVTLADGDAAAAFPSRAAQQVRKLPDGSAEITVDAVRPDTPAGSVVDAPPTESDRRSTNLVQSDDPTVAGLAAEAAGAEVDPWRIAINLEVFVRTYLRSVTFSDAFASAAE